MSIWTLASRRLATSTTISLQHIFSNQELLPKTPEPVTSLFLRSDDAAIARLLENGEEGEAKDLFRSMLKEKEPTSDTCSKFVIYHIKNGNGEKAASTIQEFLSLGASLDTKPYSILLNHFVNTGNVEGVLKTTKSVEEANLEVDIEILDKIFKLSSKYDQHDQVETIWDQMQSLSLKQSKSIPISSYNYLIQFHTTQGKQSENKIYDLLEDMVQQRIKVTEGTYIALIRYFEHQKKWEQIDFAMSLFASLKMKFSCNIFTLLLRIYGERKDIEKVKFLDMWMNSNGIGKDTICQKAHLVSLLQCDEVKGALKLIQEERTQPNFTTEWVAPLIRYYSTNRKMKVITKIHEEITSSSCTYEITYFNAMIIALCREGSIPKLAKLFQTMKKAHIEPSDSTLNIIKKNRLTELFDNPFNKQRESIYPKEKLYQALMTNFQ